MLDDYEPTPWLPLLAGFFAALVLTLGEMLVLGFLAHITSGWYVDMFIVQFVVVAAIGYKVGMHK